MPGTAGGEVQEDGSIEVTLDSSADLIDTDEQFNGFTRYPAWVRGLDKISYFHVYATAPQSPRNLHLPPRACICPCATTF